MYYTFIAKPCLIANSFVNSLLEFRVVDIY